MLKKLKLAVAKFIAKNGDGLAMAWKNEQLSRLSKLKNAKVSADFVFGDGLSVVVEGDVDELVIGERVYLRKFCNLLLFPGSKLVIEHDVFMNNYCSINCLGSVTIGANTLFGEGVKIYDHNHKFSYLPDGSLEVNRTGFTVGRVNIGRNCWIGSNVTILQNVEIGDNVIIGANALIHKSVPANTIVKHKEELIFDKPAQ